MNGFQHRTTAAAQRFAERRRLEDEAPRLAEVAPALSSLRLAIEERAANISISPKHLRHIVVGTAPALFLVACGDARCVDGGHDLTPQILPALRTLRQSFEGDHECAGMIGSSPCMRILHFQADAAYRPEG